MFFSPFFKISNNTTKSITAHADIARVYHPKIINNTENPKITRLITFAVFTVDMIAKTDIIKVMNHIT